MHTWLAVFDKPHDVTIQDGGNRGKRMTYYNVVSRLSDMGTWNGTGEQRLIEPFLTEDNAGFAVLVQNQSTGEIIGAGAIYTQ